MDRTPTIDRYLELEMQLHLTRCHHGGEESICEGFILDQMDLLWGSMTEEEQHWLSNKSTGES